jgi:hypothetical protein
MNIIIKYTQPTLLEGQIQNTVDHVVSCDDVATNPNGQPVANDANWNQIVSGLDGAGVGATYSLFGSGGYERIA